MKIKLFIRLRTKLKQVLKDWKMQRTNLKKLKKLTKQKKENQRKYKVHKTIKTLRVVKFFEIINTGELRHLLELQKSEQLPVYKEEILIPIWDKIQEEYEKESNSNAFSLLILDYDNLLTKKQEHQFLRIALKLLEIRKVLELCSEVSKEAKELLKENNLIIDKLNKLYGIKEINEQSINRIKSKLRSLKGDIEFKEEQLNKQQEKNKQNEFNIIGRLIEIENVTETNIANKYDLTVEEYLHYEKLADKIIKIKNKQAQNGR